MVATHKGELEGRSLKAGVRISQVSTCMSMFPEYFDRKQKEKKKNQKNFPAVQFLWPLLPGSPGLTFPHNHCPPSTVEVKFK